VDAPRICIDLDGVICELRRPDQSYADVEPKPGVAEALRELKDAGWYLIIDTARHMATCESNVGRVVGRVGLTTLQWLDRHGIPYDEVHFGKPNADLYVDDRGHRFAEWGGALELARTVLADRSA
jgi:capsule biosynthesis phosphatase